MLQFLRPGGDLVFTVGAGDGFRVEGGNCFDTLPFKCQGGDTVVSAMCRGSNVPE